MATNAQNKIVPEWFTPDEDKDGSADRYHIRPLDGMEFLEVSPDMYLTESGHIAYGGKAMQALIKYGLLDWENIVDPDTKQPLEFSRENVRRIPPLKLRRIAQEIANRTQLTEGEAKN